MATGNKFQQAIDIDSPSGLSFVRYYNSAAASADSSLGIGWTHTYSSRLVFPSDSTGGKIAYVKRPDGRVVTFFWQPEGTWLPDGGQTSSLVESRDATGVSVEWRFKERRDGATEVYDSSGRLVRIEPLDGLPTRLTYTAVSSRFPSQVTSWQGRSLQMHYDALGRLSEVIGSDGSVHAYAYDSANHLTSVSHPGGGSVTYLYGETSQTSSAALANALTGILDERAARYATYLYDDDGRAIASMHGDGSERYDVTYMDGVNVKVIEPSGALNYRSFATYNDIRTATNSSRSCPSCTLSRESWSYDEKGHLNEHQDGAGNITDHDQDDCGRDLVLTEAKGSPRQRTTTYMRDPSLGLVQESTTRDLAGNTVRHGISAYNARGQASVSRSIDPIDGKERESVSAYCEQSDLDAGRCPQVGLLLSVVTAGQDASRRVDYTYYPTDASTCATTPATCDYRKGDRWKVTNALGQTTEYLAYDGAGRPLSIKDANGIVTDYSYHPRGWLTASKVRGADASSEADDRITRIDYWPTGLVRQVTQPDGAFTAFTYDAAHRLTDITDKAGNTVHYTLDNAGNRIKEDTTDASGALKRTLSRVYNQLGQLKTQATAASDPTDFAYDANGNATKVTDALATATQSEYDPLNRLSRTLQDVAGIKADTKFEYDALDNLTKVTDPKGLNTTYDYNGFGELVKLTSPDTGVTSYTYDSAGNRATQTDARGNTTAYSYDALNRLTKVTYPTTSLNVTYTYDVTQTACTSGETFSIGRLTKMQDGGAITQYCYNRFGDLVRKVQTSNSKALVLRYDYTVGGQLRRMTYPDGAVVDYVRNAQGQTTQVGVTLAGGNRQVLLGNASYYPFGPAAGWTYGNGRTLARQYDLDYRPQAIQDTRPGGLDVGFGFDPAGNLTALTPAGNPAPEIGLGYDALGRLTGLTDGVTGTVIDGYSYDATGNRLSAKVGTATQAYTYPADSHRLSAVAGVARSYDATGNTTAIGGTARQYTYDTSGRMTQARRAGAVTMNYRYNGKGEQVRRFLGTTNTYTLYDEAGHWLGDYDSNGAPKQQAIWLDDLPVGLLANASKLHYIEPDHLGSPRVVIDPTRDVAVWTWSLKGEAFGNTAPNQDPDGDGAALVLDMRFPGQRFDAASGLNQNYFRDYDSGTGRYTKSDPIGLDGGISTFGYANQGPLLNIDPLGLNSIAACANPVNAAACAAAGIGAAGSVGGSATGGSAAATAAGGLAIGITAAGVRSSSTDSCPEDQCQKLYATITQILGVLKRRYWEMRADDLDLFINKPTGRMSWAGHQQQFRGWQANLRAYLEQADL
ncbi:RHS repeat-associated core domain-containing protein, partial [Xanthomonas citri]|uniref:RHS repeat-associated core domain-containing protein n=1 Tax=Xanthomonas citri TaxID=346 RepID=UPI0028748306